jgi:hypothetical protein
MPARTRTDSLLTMLRATANNGRRKELQQHFVLHLKVHGTLSNGTKVVMTESITAPIVVRGRSPRNFQARKEIPLLGSSAGSRGQALVESGLGVVAGTLGAKQHDIKARTIDAQVPRSAFTFTAPKASGAPGNPMRPRYVLISIKSMFEGVRRCMISLNGSSSPNLNC